ncbi:c-type cytochrome [Sulfitobacter sp. EhC04]|uniref:c-type cytochrome n=1 Tax=Sulfitobacter sp. EhC04 TaxID=1849168 RepID=UPI0019135DE7|nr:c-type cytochrome [Sulfitobacter sp. EhC04]
MKQYSCVVAMLALFGAPAFADEENPLFAAGETAYKSFCSHCHGLKMVNAGTTTYDLRKWPTDNPTGFYNTVRNGKGDMPAWGDILLPEEIDALWVYVATRGGTQSFPDGAEVPQEVAGQSEKSE